MQTAGPALNEKHIYSCLYADRQTPNKNHNQSEPGKGGSAPWERDETVACVVVITNHKSAISTAAFAAVL